MFEIIVVLTYAFIANIRSTGKHFLALLYQLLRFAVELSDSKFSFSAQFDR